VSITVVTLRRGMIVELTLVLKVLQQARTLPSYSQSRLLVSQPIPVFPAGLTPETTVLQQMRVPHASRSLIACTVVYITSVSFQALLCEYC
jgi:hypothetical protein